MHSQRIYPEEAWVFGVAQRDVPAHAFGEAGAGPVPEDGCHVGEGPDAVGGEGRVLRYAWKGILQSVVEAWRMSERQEQRTKRAWAGSCWRGNDQVPGRVGP